MLAVPPVAGAPLSDDYLRGYAVAVLEREFGLRARSIAINDGVLQISEADLGTADRSAVVAALARIEGVKQVVIVGASATPLPPAPGAETSSRAEAAERAAPGLPARRSALCAAPGRSPVAALRRVLALLHRRGRSQRDRRRQPGREHPLLSLARSREASLEVGVQTVVLSLFDLNTSSADLLTTDYFVAGFLGWRSGEFSGLFRLFHQSAHIGDELVERGIARRDFSAEGIDVKLSADLPAGLRVYGGVGYLIRRDPELLDPWGRAQAGLEFRSHWRAWQVVRPIAALDIQSREENDWTPAISIRAGVQFDSVQVFGRSLQLLGEYYIGDAREGQFNGRDVQYVGAGIYFSF